VKRNPTSKAEGVALDMNHLRGWIGKTETRSDHVAPAPVALLSATLDREDPPPRAGDPIPSLWHWLYFLPVHRLSELGPDGHAQRGGFLPPVPLARRMYAGGRFQFHRPLRVGDSVSRVSRVADVSHKEGRSGPLVFVQVSHEISNHEGVALTEEHDIVYRENPKPGQPGPEPQRAPEDAAWSRQIHANEVLLFRYSALTFNGHRIHYDRRYATEIEGYPGLVVHGPLIATLLLDLLRRHLPDEALENFAFRAIRPLFDTAPFAIRGKVEPNSRTIQLWAADAEGFLAMEATATLV
jgi:3-methylfumaryl-CoA hydratase